MLTLYNDEYPVLGHTYTDEQCLAFYGSESEATGVIEDGTGSSCSNPEDPASYDSECEAIKPTFLTLDHDPGGPFTWDYQGCQFTTSGVWLQTPSGQYQDTVSTAEALEVEPPAGAETNPDVTEGSGGSDSSDDFEQSTQDQCPWNYYEFSGTGYCYDGDDADVGQEYPDGSTREDHYDGSYTVTDSEGNSTEYNPDGTEKNPDSAPTGSGEGPGSPGTGCPSWAPDWLCSDSLIEEIDPDAVVEGSSINEDYEELDAAQEDYSDDLMGKFGEIGEDDSSSIADPIVDQLPTLPASSCSPVVFGVAPMQMTVPCSGFEMFRTWFAWIIYAWSALTIIDTFFTSSTKRA